MTAADLLIGHHGEEAAVVHFAADLKVLLAAQADMGRNAAFHPEPGNQEGGVIAHHLRQFSGLALKKAFPGEGAPAVQSVEAQPDGQVPQQVQNHQSQDKIQNTHTRFSVGAGTSFRSP